MIYHKEQNLARKERSIGITASTHLRSKSNVARIPHEQANFVSVNTPDLIYLEYAASSPLCLPPLSHRKDTKKNRGLLHLNNTKLKGTHHVFSRLSCWCDENMDTKIIHVSWVDPWLQCFMPVGSLPTQTHTQTTLLRDSRLHVIFPT